MLATTKLVWILLHFVYCITGDNNGKRRGGGSSGNVAVGGNGGNGGNNNGNNANGGSGNRGNNSGNGGIASGNNGNGGNGGNAVGGEPVYTCICCHFLGSISNSNITVCVSSVKLC